MDFVFFFRKTTYETCLLLLHNAAQKGEHTTPVQRNMLT